MGPWATANYCRAGIKSLRGTRKKMKRKAEKIRKEMKGKAEKIRKEMKEKAEKRKKEVKRKS